jgi:hypothetical protein
MALVVRAKIVDIRTDAPKDTDRFLVDTNAWFWLFYSRASQALNPAQSAYPAYISLALTAKANLHCSALSFAELAHNIEKTEREIYAEQANRKINTKEFRHDYPGQRRKVVTQITDTWGGVVSISTLLDAEMNTGFIQSALSLFPSVALDGYDVFMAESAIKVGITQIITDDGDYATVFGLTVFTANQKVIQAAQTAGKLITR